MSNGDTYSYEEHGASSRFPGESSESHRRRLATGRRRQQQSEARQRDISYYESQGLPVPRSLRRKPRATTTKTMSVVLRPISPRQSQGGPVSVIKSELVDPSKFGESLRQQKEQERIVEEKIEKIPRPVTRTVGAFYSVASFTPFQGVLPTTRERFTDPIGSGETIFKEELKGAYRFGSEYTGSLLRLQHDPKRQITERPFETIQTAVAIGTPAVSRAIRVLKTPTSIQFVAEATETRVAGAGAYKTIGSELKAKILKVSSEKPFVFEQSKVRKFKIDKGSVVASEGTTVTSVTPKGEGVSSFRTIGKTTELGEFQGLKVGEVSAVSQSEGTLIGTKGQTFQRGDITYTRGATTGGAVYEGFVKYKPTQTQTTSFRGTTTTKQFDPTVTSKLTSQITEKLTPTRSVKIAPPTSSLGVTSSQKPISSQISTRPTSFTFQKTTQTQKISPVVTSRGNVETRFRERTKEATKLKPALKEIPKERSMSKLKPALKTQQRTTQRTTQIRVGVTTPIIQPTPYTPPISGGFKLSTIKPFKTKSSFGKRRKQPKTYTPSGYSLVTGLTGKPTKGGIASGLGARPLKTKWAKAINI